VNLRAFQTYFGDSSGDESRFTGAGIGLTREINTVSSLGLDFQVAQQANQDFPAAAEIERFDASMTYSYALTEVVSADLGYRYSQRREDPQDATGNAVFVQIGRTFETRP
jgi:opacity protein-like surface antigen